MKRPSEATPKAAARAIRRGAPAFPGPLARIDDPPGTLWVRGTLPAGPAVAIVGSRACTAYGNRVAYRLGADAARAGLVVVSGLALGIDGAAHRGALDGGGETIAVLPCGIDRVYPARHRRLARRIVSQGALVTEFEPGTEAAPWHFRQRNRLIAGLAHITLVVEAAIRSGTALTVGYALDYNRDVMAVPGPIDAPTSAGTNALLCDGAGVCTGIDDLIDSLPHDCVDEARRRLDEAADRLTHDLRGIDPRGRAVFEAVPADGCSVEQLVEATRLPVAELLAALTDLEVRGLLRSAGGGRWTRGS